MPASPFEPLGQGFRIDPNTDLTTLLSNIIKSHDRLQKGVERVGSWVHGSFNELKDKMDTLEAKVDDVASGEDARRPALPPLSECPRLRRTTRGRRG